MPELVKREREVVAPFGVSDPFDRMFERVFDDWTSWLPFRLPMLFGREWMSSDIIRVDEYHDDGSLVVRAELPGIDPDNDVEVTISDGMLHIKAEHREEEKEEEKHYMRHELRYGSLTRTLPVPAGVSESDIKASYKDGILEIRIPAPKPEPAKKILVSKT
jgi:HSP20 family protein